VQTTANAQLGGLLNKAKKAAKDKVEKKVDNATSTTQSSSSNQTVATPAAKKKLIELTNYYVSFNEGVKTDWDYSSSFKAIDSDMKYWIHRLRTSIEWGVPDMVDKEALERLSYGVPDFEFADKKYHEYDNTYDSEAKRMIEAKIEAIQIANKLLTGEEKTWNPMGDTDEQKAKKQEEIFKMKKVALLNMYKKQAELNRYLIAAAVPKGNDAYLTKLVQDNFPEWGKVVASSMNKKTIPNTNYPNQGKRVFPCSVVCEDQGFKMVHYLVLLEPSKPNEKPKLPEGANEQEWNRSVELVK
jgi:hypothetical protein